MLESAQEAVTFLAGANRSALDQDRKLTLSLMRLIEIIGEAASQVSKEFQAENPQIPWPQIVAMRNRVIHAYFDVDLNILWDTVKDDLPPLITELEKILLREKGKPNL